MHGNICYRQQTVKNVFKIIAWCVLAVLTGIISALWMSGLIGNHRPKLATSIHIQTWESDWAIGTQATTSYMRAYIARRGLLALPKSEAVYFIRKVDDAGDALTEKCTYIVSGGAQMAKWWSMTLYDHADRLPLNEDGAYSVDQTGIGGDAWSVKVQSRSAENKTHWLSSKNAGTFDLMLRLYKPNTALLNSPNSTFNPPSIQRVNCQKGDL